MKKFTLFLMMLVAMATTVMGQGLKNGAVYKIVNVGYTGKCIQDENATNAKLAVYSSLEKQVWLAETYDDGYSLKNVATNRYLQGSTSTSGRWAMSNTPQKLYIYENSEGECYISPSADVLSSARVLCAHHPSDHAELVSWYNKEDNGNQINASTWFFEEVVARSEYEDLINEASELLNRVSERVGDEIDLTGKISSNAAHNNEDGNAGVTNDGAGIAGLLDNDPSTYFHSRWDGISVSELHYLQIDLGEDGMLDKFCFEYAVRKTADSQRTSPAPTGIEVRVSADGTNFGEPIVTLTKNNDGLPAYTDLEGNLWMSDILSAGQDIRYIRLTVTGSQGPAANQWPANSGYYFFAMGTLNIYPACVIKDEYKDNPGITEELLVETYDALDSVSGMDYFNKENLETLKSKLGLLKAAITESYTLTVKETGYATLCLGYDAAIPADVNAYIVASANNGYVQMKKVTGTLPANTAVIVNAAANDYVFAVSAGAETVVEDGVSIEDNMLEGTTAVKEVAVGDGYAAYGLAQVGDGAALCKIALADGKFSCNPNKAYLILEEPAGASLSSSLRFDFGGTTAVEKVEMRNEKEEIYDLQGRRIDEITEPGIYIVNGVKRVVR